MIRIHVGSSFFSSLLKAHRSLINFAQRFACLIVKNN